MSWECLFSQTLVEERSCSTSQCDLLYCFSSFISVSSGTCILLTESYVALFVLFCPEGFCVRLILRASQLLTIAGLLFTSTLEFPLNYLKAVDDLGLWPFNSLTSAMM